MPLRPFKLSDESVILPRGTRVVLRTDLHAESRRQADGSFRRSATRFRHSGRMRSRVSGTGNGIFGVCATT